MNSTKVTFPALEGALEFHVYMQRFSVLIQTWSHFLPLQRLMFECVWTCVVWMHVCPRLSSLCWCFSVFFCVFWLFTAFSRRSAGACMVSQRKCPQSCRYVCFLQAQSERTSGRTFSWLQTVTSLKPSHWTSEDPWISTDLIKLPNKVWMCWIQICSRDQDQTLLRCFTGWRPHEEKTWVVSSSLQVLSLEHECLSCRSVVALSCEPSVFLQSENMAERRGALWLKKETSEVFWNELNKNKSKCFFKSK